MRLKNDAELRKAPKASAASHGLLPAGTVLTFDGQAQKGFFSVSVELEDGTVKSGWVLEDQIENSDEKAPIKSLQDAENERPVVKRKRVELPEDEMNLLRREATFIYGIQAGPNLSFVQTTVNDFFYTGVGFMAGGFLGTYFAKNFPARVELNINQKNGSAESDFNSLSFNFLEVAAVGSYLMKRFEFSGGLQYSFGLGLADVPRGIVLGGPQELSSAALVLGAGYRFSGGENIAYALRLRYDLPFIQDPFSFQTVSLLLAIEFSG